jgi:hypothetical protein
MLAPWVAAALRLLSAIVCMNPLKTIADEQQEDEEPGETRFDADPEQERDADHGGADRDGLHELGIEAAEDE